MRIAVHIEVGDYGITTKPFYVGYIKLGEGGKFTGYLDEPNARVYDVAHLSFEQRHSEASFIVGFMVTDANGRAKGLACVELLNYWSRMYWRIPQMYVVRNMVVDGMHFWRNRNSGEFVFRGGTKIVFEDIDWDDEISEEIESLNSSILERGYLGAELLKRAEETTWLTDMLRNV